MAARPPTGTRPAVTPPAQWSVRQPRYASPASSSSPDQPQQQPDRQRLALHPGRPLAQHPATEPQQPVGPARTRSPTPPRPRTPAPSPARAAGSAADRSPRSAPPMTADQRRPDGTAARQPPHPGPQRPSSHFGRPRLYLRVSARSSWLVPRPGLLGHSRSARPAAGPGTDGLVARPRAGHPPHSYSSSCRARRPRAQRAAHYGSVYMPTSRVLPDRTGHPPRPAGRGGRRRPGGALGRRARHRGHRGGRLARRTGPAARHPAQLRRRGRRQRSPGPDRHRRRRRHLPARCPGRRPGRRAGARRQRRPGRFPHRGRAERRSRPRWPPSSPAAPSSTSG